MIVQEENRDIRGVLWIEAFRSNVNVIIGLFTLFPFQFPPYTDKVICYILFVLYPHLWHRSYEGCTRAVVLMTQSGLRFNLGDLSIFFIDGAV